jgi:Amt family ammonium transporter
VVSFILAKIVNATVGLRVSADDEIAGVDQTEHAETAYDFGGLSGTLHRAAVSVAAATSSGSATAGSGESDEEKVTV